jgi:hypothetical protein
MLKYSGNSEGLQILVSWHICHNVDARISAHSKGTPYYVHGSERFKVWTYCFGPIVTATTSLI